MIQYYTAIGRYELRTGSNGAKQPVLLNSSRSYEPSLCEMLLWSSLLWHIRDQQELEIVFAKRKLDPISDLKRQPSGQIRIRAARSLHLNRAIVIHCAVIGFRIFIGLCGRMRSRLC